MDIMKMLTGPVLKWGLGLGVVLGIIGLVFGLAGMIPVVGWIIQLGIIILIPLYLIAAVGSGFMASKAQGSQSMGEAAVVGLLTGLVLAVVSGIISSLAGLINILLGVGSTAVSGGSMGAIGMAGAGGLIGWLFGVVVGVGIGSVFAMVQALIGAVIQKAMAK